MGLQKQLRQLTPRPALDAERLRCDLMARVAQVQAIFQHNPAEARDVIAALIDEPLRVVEKDGGWEILELAICPGCSSLLHKIWRPHREPDTSYVLPRLHVEIVGEARTRAA